MTRPKQTPHDFTKSNAARNWTDTRICWCAGTECRWRDPGKPCPQRTDARDGVVLYAP